VADTSEDAGTNRLVVHVFVRRRSSLVSSSAFSEEGTLLLAKTVSDDRFLRILSRILTTDGAVAWVPFTPEC
jgi:hypothetical protein